MAAAGFLIANAYVDVEARFSSAQVRGAVQTGLRNAKAGIATAARTTIGKAIIDGIVEAFRANALQLEMALVRALMRLRATALAGGRDIGDSLTRGIISGLNTARLRAALQAMVAAAGAGLSTTVDVRVRENKSATSKFAKGLLSSMGSLGKKAGMTLGGALAVSAAAGLTQNAAILTTEVVNMIGIIGLLPGAAMAAGVAFGTLKLAFFRVGEALSAGLEGDMKKYNDLLEGMPRKAQDATKALLALGMGLKVEVMNSFWKEVNGSIRDLGKVYVPMVREAFGDVATSLGRAFSAVLDLLNTKAMVSDWRNAFISTGNTIDNIAKGLPGLVSALTPLFVASSAMVANLTGGFDGLMGTFTAWSERVTSDGSFEEFVNKGLDAVGDLFKALGEITSLILTVFGGISEGGGTVLEALGQAAAGLNDFFKNTEAGQGILSALGEGFTTISGILVELVRAAGPGIKDLLAGLVGGLVALAPAAKPVGEALGAVMSALAPLLPVIGTTLANALTLLATLLKVVAPWIGMVVSLFSQLYMAVAPKLLPVLEEIGKQMMPIVVEAMENFFDAMEPLIPVIADIYTQLVAQLMPHIPELVGMFKELVPKAAQLAKEFGGALLEAIQTLAPMMPDLVESGLELVKAFLELYIALYPLLSILTPIITKLIEWSVESGTLEFLMGAFIGVVMLMTEGLKNLKIIINFVIEAFKWLGDVFAWLWDKAKWIWDRIKDFTLGLWETFKEKLQWIKDKWNESWEWIKTKVSEFIETIKTKISDWVGKIKGFFLDLWTNVKNGWSEGWTWVRDKAQEWVDKVKGIITGIKDKFVEVVGNIPGALKDKANGLIDFFNGLIDKVNIILPVKIGKIPRLADGGQVGGKGNTHFADGGSVSGPGGPRADKIPAMLSDGEFVVNAASTKRWLPLLQHINNRRAPDSATKEAVGHYADGGLVGGLSWDIFTDPAKWVRGLAGNFLDNIPGVGIGKDAITGIGRKTLDGLISFVKDKLSFSSPGGANGNWPSSPGAQRGDSGVWRSIVSLIRSTGPASGAFGNSYRPGDPLWHGSGRAVDWMGYNQDFLASFLAARRPLELIHRTKTRDYAYTRGKDKGSFNNSLMEAHRNHIHIAMKDGGLVPQLFDQGGPWESGTIGMNTSGHTEQVLTRAQIDQLSGATGQPQTIYHFEPGSVVLDASKVRSVQDLLNLMNGIQATARQHGARSMALKGA